MTAVALDAAPPPPATVVSGGAPRGAEVPDLHRIVNEWDAVIAHLRGTGRELLAALLGRVQPSAVTAAGLLTLECDDPGDIPVVSDGLSHVTEALRAVIPGIARVQIKPPAEGAQSSRERLTTEGVKQERVALLSKQDPVLGAAVTALDLELLE